MSIYDRDTGIFAGERVGHTSPAPPRPSFQGIVANGLADSGAITQTLTETRGSFTDPTGAHVGDVYTQAIGGAPDALNSETASVASSPAPQLNDAGQIVPGRAGQVARYLPDPNSDVRVGLVDPPKTPGGGDENGVGRERPYPRPKEA